MINWSRLLPYLVAGGAALYLLVMAVPPGDPDGQMHVEAFARLPVQDGGRIKPIDTVARNSFMIISDRSKVTLDDGTTLAPSRWLLDAMTLMLNGKGLKEKVVRIENEELLNILELPLRPGDFHYSLEELQGKFDVLKVRAREARKRRRDGATLDKVDEKLLTLDDHLGLYLSFADLENPRTVPPARGGDDWLTSLQVAQEQKSTGTTSRAGKAVLTILASYSRDDTSGFNQAVNEYRRYLEREMPGTVRHADVEYAFNRFNPFAQCGILYVAACLLVFFSWLGSTGPLNRAAFWLLVLTLVVHTAALIGRMYLMERWLVFVTNLYSSALFIGWGCCVIGLILERLFGHGLGNLVAGVAGAVTMLIAHNLGSGDTLEMMQAVLDTNFWLATHVTCVTMGYTATFVAGLLAIMFIVRGVLTPSLDRTTFTLLTQALYGVICFATLFSFTGTVLGGIWADQSWGRFWGWDPKENGALLIVLWNALILHARWGGLVKQRGMAVLAVFGNIVTLWSWFGVNMLGVGLHSYGWMQFNAILLATFIPLHLGVIALGLVPLKHWRSFGQARAEVPPPALPTPPVRKGSTHVVAAR